MHVCGVLRLPQYYKDPWKTQFHRYYRACNLGITGVSTTSMCINLFMNTRKNLPLFCANFFVISIIIMILGVLYYANAKVETFLKILDLSETLENFHSDNKAVTSLRTMEKKIILVGLVTVAVALGITVVLYPLIPKVDQELETLTKLYGLKYPHNSLPLQWYVPFIDTSEPKIYPFFFALYVYMTFLQSLAIVLSLASYPTFVFHLKSDFMILRDFTVMLGKPHFDKHGQLIFFTHLMKNEKVVRQINATGIKHELVGRIKGDKLQVLELELETPAGRNKPKEQEIETVISQKEMSLSQLFEQNPHLYTTFYLGQIIRFHKQLTQQRDTTDDLCHNMFIFFILLLGLILTVSMYGSLTPILPMKDRILTRV
ncbi:hypothetical protein WDU94_009910 [Cyamophila willieti]